MHDKNALWRNINRVLLALLFGFLSFFVCDKDGGFSVFAFSLATIFGYFSSKSSRTLSIISVLFTYLYSVILFGHPLYSLFILAVLPFPMLFSYVSSGKMKRQSALLISVISVTFIITSIGIYKVWINNGINVQSIRSTFPGIVDGIEGFFAKNYSYKVAGVEVAAESNELFKSSIDLILFLLPAIIATVSYLYFFIVSKILGLMILYKNDSNEYLEEIWKIRVNPITALFSASSLILANLFYILSVDVLFITFATFFLIVAPQTLFEGVISSFERKKLNDKFVRPVIKPTILITSAFFTPIIFVWLALIFGCVDSMNTYIIKNNKDKEET